MKVFSYFAFSFKRTAITEIFSIFNLILHNYVLIQISDSDNKLPDITHGNHCENVKYLLVPFMYV